MPIAIEGGRIPALLQLAKGLVSAHPASASPLRIALVNNMPDAALEDTELQFFDLLHQAAGDLPLTLQFFSLPDLPHADSGRAHLEKFYSSLDDLRRARFDGAIVTGTEPRRPNLREEPYWPALLDLLDWAENKTSSTVLSCLAAHAGVFASDNIPRSPLADKQFGVFEHQVMSAHPLTAGLGSNMHVPHSRWNEVKAGALESHGYEILTQSPGAGVDLFVKQRGQSLFVHFQGHPEYSARTLLKEYRRDIRRYLRHERDTYPSLPSGYFDATATDLLAQFREKAVAARSEEMFAAFPESSVASTVQNVWQPSAATVYRNWLHLLRDKKAAHHSPASMSPAARA
ncbi:MAG TPA: homoserine O-succinyltransferase [Candidatus Acidoferrales bacterium]